MSSSLFALNGQDDPRNLLPEGWVAKQLGVVCEIFGGGRLGLTKEKDYQSSGVLAFSAAGPDGYVEKAEVTGKDGVILSAIGANCGRCFFASGEWTTLANVQAIVPKAEIDAKYLFYYVNRDRYWDRSGSAQPFIKPSSIHSSWVVYPSNGIEQNKIAEVLDTIDRGIAQTEALIAKQQRIKTGLMQDLLTKGIDEHGNIRSEATHAFKDSPLGRIPVEWVAKLLDDCVRSDAPICYGILMPGSGVDDGVPVIKVKDIFDGAICLDDILLTDPKIDAAYKRSRLRANDLLITIRGTTGRVALVPPVLDGANITQDTARIRLKYGHLPVYFFYLLQSAGVQAQVDLETLGQAVKGINIAEVRKLIVPVPPEDEQKRICQLLEQIHLAWQASVKYRDKLLLQKAGLMKDLLTGKRRITPLLAQVAPQ
jgi:type I restriction enzyme S subunit